MDISQKLFTIQKQILSLATKLQELQPSHLLSNYRFHHSPISLNLNTSNILLPSSGRTYSISFGGFGSSKNPEASNMLLSVSDEGELTIWNLLKSRAAFKANIYSEDPWLMTCSFEHTEGSTIATGGMEGKIHLFKLIKKSSDLTISEHPIISIHAHDNYISKCEFLTNISLLTTSGDKTCKLWPIEPRPEPIQIFEGHTQDVLGLSVTPTNPNLFITGGCDGYVKVWDIRGKKSIWEYLWNGGNVNTVKFLKDSEQTFVAGHSDGNVKVFDLRIMRETARFCCGNSVTEAEISKSGRIVFAGDQGGYIKVWDLLDDRVPLQVINLGGEGVSGIGISPVGDTLCCATFEGGIFVMRNKSPGD